jgi:hypothetical protein
MISRKSTKILAELYKEIFSGTYQTRSEYGRETIWAYELYRDLLQDYFFERDYPSWFLFIIKHTNVFEERAIIELIQGLHTGSFIINYNFGLDSERINSVIIEGKELLPKLSVDILNYVFPERFEKYSDSKKEMVNNFVNQLELDGYKYHNRELFQYEKNIFDEEEKKELITQLISELSFQNQEVITHHLNLIETNYLQEKWDDSIGNSRKFFEAILKEIADQYSLRKYSRHLPEEIIGWPVEVRKYLEKENLFEKQEIFTIKEIYSLMSETGNHPYIADKEQALFLRNLSLIISHFSILKLIGWLNS